MAGNDSCGTRMLGSNRKPWLSMGRAGPFLGWASCSLPARHHLLSWAVFTLHSLPGGRKEEQSWEEGVGHLWSPFLSFPAYVPLPAQLFLQKQLLGQRAVHRQTRGGVELMGI